MAVLDLTPGSDENANQTLAELARTPEGQAAIAKLSATADAASKAIAQISATPALDAIIATRTDFLADFANTGVASVLTNIGAQAQGVLDSWGTVMKSSLFAEMECASTILAKSMANYPFSGVASVLDGMSFEFPDYLSASSVLTALAPSEIAAFEAFRFPEIAYSPLLAPQIAAQPPVDVERQRIDELEDEVADLNQRVCRAEAQAERFWELSERILMLEDMIAYLRRELRCRDSRPIWPSPPDEDLDPTLN